MVVPRGDVPDDVQDVPGVQRDVHGARLNVGLNSCGLKRLECVISLIENTVFFDDNFQDYFLKFS